MKIWKTSNICKLSTCQFCFAFLGQVIDFETTLASLMLLDCSVSDDVCSIWKRILRSMLCSYVSGSLDLKADLREEEVPSGGGGAFSLRASVGLWDSLFTLLVTYITIPFDSAVVTNCLCLHLEMVWDKTEYNEGQISFSLCDKCFCSLCSVSSWIRPN